MEAQIAVIAIDTVVFSLYAYGMSRLLPMRWPAVFIVAFAATPLFLDNVGYLFLSGGAAIALFLAVAVLLPYLLFEGSRFIRALAVLMGTLGWFLCQLAGSLLMTLLVGQPIPEEAEANEAFYAAHLPEYMLEVLAGVILFLALMSYLGAFLRNRAGLERTRTAWILIAFVGLHGSLLFVSGIVQAMVDATAFFYAFLSAAGIACFVGDVLVVSSLERYVEKKREDERAMLLQEQLDAYLAHCEPIAREIELAAKMRHDLRNQMQIITDLAERGMAIRAQDHVRQLKEDFTLPANAPREGGPA